jgi:hypothetical protein
MRAPVTALALLFALLAPARAHDVSRSESKVDIDGREVRVLFTLNPAQLRDPVMPAQVPEAIGSIYALVQQHYSVRSPAAARGEEPRVSLEKYEMLANYLMRMEVLYVFGQDVREIEITSTLDQIMQAGHEHLMSVRLNGTLHEAILNAGTPSARFTGVQATNWQTFWRFTRLGIEHIFTGYDHLAFLLGLLVATTTLGSLVKVITSFTLAHSITLALATFNLVNLPSRLTESMIAVSIGYIAAENLLDFRAMKRYYVTFFFGLIHGFGFSTVLRDMQLPRSSLALSLFSFNFGVEIGQVTFVLLIFPLVQDLVKSGWNRLKPAVSAGVACLAAYWFVQRAFMG